MIISMLRGAICRSASIYGLLFAIRSHPNRSKFCSHVGGQCVMFTTDCSFGRQVRGISLLVVGLVVVMQAVSHSFLQILGQAK